MPDVTVGGVRFNTVRLRRRDVTDEPPPPGQPEGPPVVFLHGLIMDNLSSWYYTLAPTVALTHEVVCYDLRGHGRSDRPRSGYRLEDAVDDLFGVVDALGIAGPVHLVGNSFGGVVALAFASLFPERVASLVLIEAHFATEGWGEHMAGSLALAAFGLDKQSVKEWLDRNATRKVSRLAQRSEHLFLRTSLIDDLQRELPVPRRDLEGIACPTLAIYGEGSDILDRARDLERYVPDCSLYVVPDCTHSVLFEATPFVREHVVSWISNRHAAVPA
jgi:pimeloyl-ACP methyl ester carboxylesterase